MQDPQNFLNHLYEGLTLFMAYYDSDSIQKLRQKVDLNAGGSQD